MKQPTVEYSRGLSSYKLDTLMRMEKDYKSAIDKGEIDDWTTGRLQAIRKEIKRRKEAQ